MNSNKILRELQHENVSKSTILEFRTKNPKVHWSTLNYQITGDSILHIAAREGKDEIVNYILTNWPPVNVNIKNNDCKTPLHEAAQFSQTNIVKLLLEHNAEIDAIKRADWTPLMLASTKTSADALEVVKLLVQNGANVNLVNKDGWNALHLACREGNLKIVDYLVNSSANFSALTNNGRSVLHIASLHGHVDIVQLLLLKNDLININVKDNCGNTPFCDAVCSGNTDLVRLFVENRADIASTNVTGLSALHLAASEGLNSMVVYLIQELKIDPNIKTQNGVTALHCAARKKQSDIVNDLVSLGANKNMVDNHGRSAEDYLLL